MITELCARTISASLQRRLYADTPQWRVLAVFEHVCNLARRPADGGPMEIAALVQSSVGDGPLNIVVDTDVDWRDRVSPQSKVMYQQGRMHIDTLVVRLDCAAAWEPRPDWQRCRLPTPQLNECLAALLSCAQREAPAGSLLALLPGSREIADDVFFAAARRALAQLRAGWPQGGDTLAHGAAGLAGLGAGLTPAGDDFLMGAMLALWWLHPAPARRCETIVNAAAPRTTALSAALLRCAAAGECGIAWQQLLALLSRGGDTPALERGVRAVLAHGHTSGADTLAGFLWMAATAAR